MEPSHEKPTNIEPISQESQELQIIRKSSRARKLTISSDYIVYFQESDYDVGPKDDPTLFL